MQRCKQVYSGLKKKEKEKKEERKKKGTVLHQSEVENINTTEQQPHCHRSEHTQGDTCCGVRNTNTGIQGVICGSGIRH